MENRSSFGTLSIKDGSSNMKLGILSNGKVEVYGDIEAYNLHPTKALGLTYVGTGINFYTKEDILFASENNFFAKLPKGTDRQVLKLSGGVPKWLNNNFLFLEYWNKSYWDFNNDSSFCKWN